VKLLLESVDVQTDFANLIENLHSHPTWTSLHHACALGIDKFLDVSSRDDIIKYNLTKNESENEKVYIFSDVNIPTTSENLYPLHLAAKNGRANLIPKLFHFGADLATVDVNGMNALHFAAQADSRTILVSLILKCRTYLT